MSTLKLRIIWLCPVCLIDIHTVVVFVVLSWLRYHSFNKRLWPLISWVIYHLQFWCCYFITLTIISCDVALMYIMILMIIRITYVKVKLVDVVKKIFINKRLLSVVCSFHQRCLVFCWCHLFNVFVYAIALPSIESQCQLEKCRFKGTSDILLMNFHRICKWRDSGITNIFFDGD